MKANEFNESKKNVSGKATNKDIEPLKWWREFKEKEIDNNLVCKFVEKIEKLENGDSIEAIEKVMEKVMSSKMTAEQKEMFERLSKIYSNRIDRRIGENFGALIKQLRKSNGYTLTSLAEITGISASYINRMEHGERKAPSVPIITKLSEALNVSTEELLEVAGISSGQGNPSGNAIDFYRLVISNEVTLGEKPQSRNQIDALLKIIKTIEESEWSDKSKYTDTIKVMEAVDSYKSI